MSDLAAISASLVNMRNVGTHKSVALTVHVPEEMAQRIVDIFGWPTMSTPVPVAIARLKETPADTLAGQDGEAQPPAAGGDYSPRAVSPSASKKAWHELPASQQAAIRCGELSFHRYLGERACCTWSDKDNEWAAKQVRRLCFVDSRKDLDGDEFARWQWHQLDTDYLVWSGKLAEPR